MEYNGEYGGRVLRGFKGDGTSFISGAIISPEQAEKWPLSNRRALQRTGNIEWFAPPADDEQKARVAGKPAPERKKAEPATTAAKKSSRTKVKG